MENLINTITSNPIYMVIAVIIVVAVAISIVKKLFKALILAIAVLIIYLGYMSYTGQKIPTSTDDIIKHGTKQIEKMKKAGEKKMGDVINKKIQDSTK